MPESRSGYAALILRKKNSAWNEFRYFYYSLWTDWAKCVRS